MSQQRHKVVQPCNDQVCHVPNFHGASIVTEDGKEIPITEKMVQSACNEFIEIWEADHKRQH